MKKTSKQATPDSKVGRIVTRCVYDIATGALPAGRRLPSIREAEQVFDAHQLTVLSAYRELVRLGLVRNVPRSGFFVAAGDESRRLSQYRFEMESLYAQFATTIRDRTGLSPLGAFRYLSRLAEARAQDAPECAFVECTAWQAKDHADEIRSRLGVPCVPITTAQISERPSCLPTSIRTLVTTHFHVTEVTAFADRSDLVSVGVVIELAPESLRQLRDATEVVVISLDQDRAERIAWDLGERLGERAPKCRALSKGVEELDQTLAEHLGRPDVTDQRTRVFLSPSHWEARPNRWRRHPAVVPMHYRIREADWSNIGDAIGLPVCVGA